MAEGSNVEDRARAARPRWLPAIALSGALLAGLGATVWLRRPPPPTGTRVEATGLAVADGPSRTRRPPRTGADPSVAATSSTTPPPSAPSTVPPTTAPPGPPRVLVVGDSLVVQSTAALERRAGDRQLEIHAVARTTIGDWLPFAPGLVSHGRPDVVVVALGTNDNWPTNSGEVVEAHEPTRLAGHRARVRQLLDHVSSARCVVWVEPSEIAPMSEYLRYATANGAVLREELAAHGARATSWTAALAADEARAARWILDDGIHLSAEGQEAFAGLIVEAVDRC